MSRQDALLKRQSSRIKFKNEDMDFALSWVLGIGQIIGMGPGEVLATASTIRDGDPRSWRAAFQRQGDHLSQLADTFDREGNPEAAGHCAFGATYARRASLHFADPASSTWNSTVAAMEREFERGATRWSIPVRAVSVPFEGHSLPGYYLESTERSRPTLLVIGGGDTFREDLFYFGGYPGWQRGYNVLLVDLPGQGNTPASGLTFRADAAEPISACLDWLAANSRFDSSQIAVQGLSGGGYLTAQAVAVDPRINAWIASTPITDVGLVFEREMGAALRTPGWLLDFAAGIIGKVSDLRNVVQKKYAWQFGSSSLAEVARRVRAEAPVVAPGSIDCPALFLLGDGEAAELKRQTTALASAMRAAGHDVTVRRFCREEGDAHCQVNNLRLAHLVMFDWLDRVFGVPTGGED